MSKTTTGPTPGFIRGRAGSGTAHRGRDTVRWVSSYRGEVEFEVVVGGVTYPRVSARLGADEQWEADPTHMPMYSAYQGGYPDRFLPPDVIHAINEAMVAFDFAYPPIVAAAKWNGGGWDLAPLDTESARSALARAEGKST